MFWILLLAHLIGDYPLQPIQLLDAKKRTWGLLLHASIQFLMMVLLVGSLRTFIWPVLLVVAALHFFIDMAKVNLGGRHLGSAFQAYLLDQALHLLILLLATVWIGAILPAGMGQPDYAWAVYISGLLLVTYVWYTTEKVWASEDQDYLAEIEGSAIGRMLTRAAMLLLFLFLGRQAFIGLPMLAILIPYQSSAYRKRELATDFAVALVTAAIVLLGLP